VTKGERKVNRDTFSTSRERGGGRSRSDIDERGGVIALFIARRKRRTKVASEGEKAPLKKRRKGQDRGRGEGGEEGSTDPLSRKRYSYCHARRGSPM